MKARYGMRGIVSRPLSTRSLPTAGAQIDSAGSFDYGLPFFYGRNVFTAIEDASTPAGNGPYFGF